VGWLERVVAYVSWAGAIAWAGCVLGFASDAGMSLPALMVLGYGGFGILGISCSGLALRVWMNRRGTGRRSVVALLVQPALIAACFAFVGTGAAFEVRFRLSRSALDRFAVEAQHADSGVHALRWVGLFWLRELEVLEGGVVRMITSECHGVDHCGLAYSRGAPPPRVGEDIYRPLGGGWYHWRRSW
jgi:hypothetical protein